VRRLGRDGMRCDLGGILTRSPTPGPSPAERVFALYEKAEGRDA
jgi:hypothetical protein